MSIRELEIALAECTPLSAGQESAINAISGDHENGDRIVEVAELHIDVIALAISVDRIHARLFSRLLDRLSAYSTPSGTLLDDGVCAWINDLANGPPHSINNLPYVLAGSAKGYLRNGVYVDAGGVKHNRMLNTIATAVGLRKGDGGPVDDFGDASLQRGLIDQMIA